MDNRKRLHSNVEEHEESIKRRVVDHQQEVAAADALASSDDVNFKDSENYVRWQNTISKVVNSVVSIHFAQVAPFDCDPALVSEATGFVVDSDLGIILTNRHVVGAGPFVGYVVFDNHERCV